MEMKKSKKEVLAICGVIAIIVVMIAGVMLLTKNKVNKEEQSQETKVDDVLAKVNELKIVNLQKNHQEGLFVINTLGKIPVK